jgi:hypothetical protein
MRQVLFVVVLPNGNVVEPRVENGCRVWGSAGRSKECEVPGGLAEPTARGKREANSYSPQTGSVD